MTARMRAWVVARPPDLNELPHPKPDWGMMHFPDNTGPAYHPPLAPPSAEDVPTTF